MEHYENIVVAVDGSALANKAFEKAVDIAGRNIGSTLHVIHIIDTSFSSTFDMLYDNMVELVREHGEVLLASCETYAKEQGIANIRTHLVKGTPKNILAKKLRDIAPPDLIVCGATGMTDLEQIFLGSNTDAIVRYAKCDVLVVKA